MPITSNVYRGMSQIPAQQQPAGGVRRLPAAPAQAQPQRTAAPVAAPTRDVAPPPPGVPRPPAAPLAGTGAGGAQPPQPPVNQFADIEGYYNDLLKQHESTWGAQEDAINRATSAGRRRAMAIDARMGSGVGGAFLSGYRQAEVGGMQQMTQARQQHDIAGRNLAREYFQSRLDRANRLQEQQFQREQQARNFDMEVAKLMAEANQELPADLAGRLNVPPGLGGASAGGGLVPDAQGNYVSGGATVPAKQVDDAINAMLKKYKILDQSPARMEAVRRYIMRAAASGRGMPGPEHLKNIYLGQSDTTKNDRATADLQATQQNIQQTYVPWRN